MILQVNGAIKMVKIQKTLFLLLLRQAFKVQAAEMGAFAVQLWPLVQQVSLIRQGDFELFHVAGWADIACWFTAALYALYDAPWNCICDVLLFQWPYMLGKFCFEFSFVIEWVGMLVEPGFEFIPCGPDVNFWCCATCDRRFIYHVSCETCSLKRARAVLLAVASSLHRCAGLYLLFLG